MTAKSSRGQRYAELDLSAVQLYADTHSPKETVQHFSVSYKALKRRGIKFKKFQKPTSEQLKQAEEIVKTESTREAARRVGVSLGALQRRGIGSGNRPGRPPVDKAKMLIFRFLVAKKKLSYRKAEAITGISRVTERKYRKKALQNKLET